MKSILGKILVYLGGTILVAVVCIGFVTTSFVSDTVLLNEQQILKDDSKKSTLYVEGYFQKYISMMQQMARDKSVIKMLSSDADKENYKDSEYYQDVFPMLVESAASDKENILTTYVAKLSGNFAFDNEEWLSSEDFDLNKKDYWFKDTADINNGFIICDPYFDESANSMVTTISAPVYDDDKTGIIGVVAVDFKVTTICDMITNGDSTYETGYRVLISDSGDVLAHKDQDKVLKKYDDIGFDQTIISAINDESDEIISFNDNNVKSHAAVGREKNSGWRVVNIVTSDEFTTKTDNIVKTIMMINGVAMIVIVGMIFVIARSISKPLAKLTGVTDRMAGGDLDVEINIHSKDEVGRLAQSMSILTERLKTYIAYIDETSSLLTQMGNGDLNLSFNQAYDGDFKKIKDAFILASDKLNNTLSECNAAAEQVSSGSEQVSSGAQALSQGATEQASSIQELSATINEITEQINNTAENAKQAKLFSEQASVATEHSQQQMQEMVLAMDAISSTANEIGKIMKSIDDIAFQTNILALNAAVEAARAGAAGKGFAVVADEVRNLAAKSAESAKSTATLIDNTLNAINRGSEIVAGTAQSLIEVVESTQKAASSIQDISDASNKQAQSIYQINIGVEQISSVVQNNSATAEQSAAASQQLSGQAQVLKDFIGQFKLNN